MSITDAAASSFGISEKSGAPLLGVRLMVPDTGVYQAGLTPGGTWNGFGGAAGSRMAPAFN